MKQVFTFILLAMCASLAALAGIYTVGGSEADYATLTEAIADLNAEGLTANTEFILRPGTYEGPFVLQHQSRGYELNIHSAYYPVNDVILYNPNADIANNYIIKLDNVSKVKLHKMKFVTSGSYNVAVQIKDNSDNTSITSCQFQGQVNASSNNSGAISITASGNGDADNLYIAQNSFHDGGYHIYCNSSSYNDSFANWEIINNYFENGYTAMYIKRFSGLTIKNNDINSSGTGIYLDSGSGSLEISQNKISGGGKGLYVNGVQASSQVPHIFNNIISVNGNYGIYVDGNGLNILHNSVLNSSANTYDTYAGSFRGSNLKVRKNHFLTTGGGITLYAQYVDPQNPQRNIIEHNNLYSYGLYIARLSNDNYKQLWEFENITQTHNVSINPFFSADLLNTVSPALDNMFPSTAVSTDYNGLPRDPLNSDIGAHEYTANPALTPMSGDYNIGSGQAYQSIQAFFDDLSLRGVSGPVNGKLTDELYEEQIVVHAIPGGGSPNIVTLKSIRNLGSTISYSEQSAAQPYIMSLTRTDRIEFDRITFSTTATSNSNLLLLKGYNKNLKFRYMDFNAPANSAGVSLGALSGSEADYIHIFSLSFNGNGFGVESRGENWYSYACVFDNQYQGFLGQSAKDIWIENSTFTNARNLSLNISSAQNITILQNRFSGSKKAISLSTSGSADTRSLIANNTVNIQSNAVEGISIYGSGINVLNNSVQVRGENSKGIYSYSLGTDIDIVNNALSSDLGRALEFGSFSPAPSVVIDYNCYYTEGNLLAKMGGDYTSLSELQSAYPDYNQHSISVNPHFSDDMHTQSPWLRHAGIFRPEIENDMDNEPRGGSFDIGADQQTGELIETRLAGNYTIGENDCDYPSLEAAIDALEFYGISADVSFEISAGNYPGYYTVRDFPKTNPELKVFFNASEGANFTMLPSNTYSYENYFFRLVGVNNLYFTGIQMALEAANKQSTFFVLDGYCENINISGSTFNLYNPLASSNTAISTGTFRGKNLKVENCSFVNGDKGVSIPGDYYDTLSYTGVEIIGNTFSDVKYPINIQKAVDVKIKQNQMDDAIQAISLSNITGISEISRNRIISSGFTGTYNSHILVNLNACNGESEHGFNILNNIIMVAESSAQSATAFAIVSSSHIYMAHNNIINENSTYNENSAALSLSNVSTSSFWNNILSAPASGMAAIVSSSSDCVFQNNAWYGSWKYVVKQGGVLKTAEELLDEIDLQGYFANPLPNASGYSQCSYLQGKAAVSSVIADIDNIGWNGTPDIGAAIIPGNGSPISGVKYVGENEEYPNLATAWEDLQKRGISGNVHLKLSSGTMDCSAVLGYVPNSLENRITIRGATRPDITTLSKTATSEADNYILKLYNTRNLRLEGIVFNAGNPAYSKGIELQRYTYNFEIMGGVFSTATNSQTDNSNAALYSAGATLENCTMQFSTVENLAFGVYISASQNQDISNTGVYIAGNSFTGNYSGISLYHVESPQVLGNNISASRGYGIFAGQGVKDLSIQANQISGCGQGGINLSNLGSGIHELINNFVNTGASAMYSIKVENSPSVKLYHNTIVNSSANAEAAAFYQAASSAGLVYRNNIAVAATGYAAWFNRLVDITISRWDYNLYHSTGANIVRVGASIINNTEALDALVGGLDSIMADPLLIGGGFQISAASPAYNAGISLSFVSYDILGQVRDDHPDIGCYEYHAIPLSAPQNLQISLSPDQGQISLSWDGVAGAVSYYVQSASDPYSEDWQDVPGASTNETSISFPVPDGQRCFYRVRAIGAE